MNLQVTLPLPPTSQTLDQLPHHVAVIMDGNGRWATQRHLPRSVGHRQGVVALQELLHYCCDLGIKTLTVYAFSTENWQRPSSEVSFLLQLFEHMLHAKLIELHEAGIKLQILGEVEALPIPLKQVITQATRQTQANQALTLNVALNYGGHREITLACQSLAQRVHQGCLDPAEITADHIEQALMTPAPDLLIRTGGNYRLSNFLLWQLAYTELYFTPILWPDFDRIAFDQALSDYQLRERRFGRCETL